PLADHARAPGAPRVDAAAARAPRLAGDRAGGPGAAALALPPSAPRRQRARSVLEAAAHARGAAASRGRAAAVHARVLDPSAATGRAGVLTRAARGAASRAGDRARGARPLAGRGQDRGARGRRLDRGALL